MIKHKAAWHSCQWLAKTICFFFVLAIIPTWFYAQFTEIPTPFSIEGSVAWGDFDSDSDLDLLKGSVLYRNDGNGTFIELTTSLSGGGKSSWGDYDNDGDLDILLGNQIYRNDTGTFLNIDAGLVGDNGEWGDYENDGDLDVLMYDYGTTRIYVNNGGGSFTNLNISFPVWTANKAGWADSDNDGDLDVFTSGTVVDVGYSYTHYTRLYRNDGNGIFTHICNFGSMVDTSTAWGDYDNDGDLDLLISGFYWFWFIEHSYLYIYRNNGNNSFTNIGAGLTPQIAGALAWGDYDNDGDLDILTSGKHIEYDSGTNEDHTKVYRNDGNNVFVDINAGFVPTNSGFGDWGDYDNDGDLDFVYTGEGLVKLYRNDSTIPNSAPSAPTNLRTVQDGITRILRWDSASDNQTPANGLKYIVKCGTTPGGCDVSSPMAKSNGFRLIPITGVNNAATGWKLNITPSTPTTNYYFSVQTVDTALSGSAFSQEIILPALKLTYPNGGEVWQLATTQAIYWSSCIGVSGLNVMFSSNNGASWITLNENPISASAGSYQLSVPAVISTQCRIKLADASNPDFYDMSDEVFSINPSPTSTITLTAPTLGKLQTGRIYDIQWISTGVTNVRLDYSINNGISWNVISASTPAASGTYTWTVPNLPLYQCYVKITDASNSTVYDMNDELYTLIYLQVLSPNGGGLYAPGQVIPITWSSVGVDTIKILYSTNSGAGWGGVLVASVDAAVGNYNWTVPSSYTAGFMFMLRDNSESTIHDTSDTPFTIAQVYINYPSATGIRMQAGKNVTIRWGHQYLSGTVTIQLSTDSGTTYSTIASGIDTSLGSWVWVVSDTPSTTCRIKIYSNSNPLILDLGDNLFTICRLELTSPNGAEEWSIAASRTITWTSINVPSIRINYSIDNGANWAMIVSSTPASSGSYVWTVPTAYSTNCKIRILDVNNMSTVNDDCDATFIIDAGITVTAPNGGEIVSVNSICDVSWTAREDVQYVLLDYSTNNGSTWTAIQSSAYNASLGVYSWIVPNTLSTNCLMRVKNSENVAGFDISNAVFTISAQQFPPTVNFSANVTSGYSPLDVQFTDQSVSGSGYLTSWEWIFGDGATSTDRHPLHTYSAPGEYTVSLTATNSLGLSNTFTRTGYITVLMRNPLISLSPSSLDFGNVPLGSQSTLRPVWIKNTGTSELVINSVSLQSNPSPFHVYNVSPPVHVPVGDSTFINLRFIPVSLGAAVDSLVIANNSTNAPLCKAQLRGVSGNDLPLPPAGVQVSIDENDSALITWLPVTETVFGTPITPDRYIVLYNETPFTDTQNYYYLTSTTNLSATHYEVAMFRDNMFYKVIAIKFNRYNSILDELTAERKITWGELQLLLQ